MCQEERPPLSSFSLLFTLCLVESRRPRRLSTFQGFFEWNIVAQMYRRGGGAAGGVGKRDAQSYQPIDVSANLQTFPYCLFRSVLL